MSEERKEIFRKFESITYSRGCLFQIKRIDWAFKNRYPARNELLMEKFKEMFLQQYGSPAGNLLYDIEEDVLWFPDKNSTLDKPSIYFLRLPG